MRDVDLELPERYELADDPLLGQGGMGRVLRARDRVLDLPVAIKVVRPELAADPRFRKLFDLEVRVSARFTHPHIVPLHDHGELADGTPFLGLALADAGSFKTLNDSNPTDWNELLRLFLELLDALAHLHAWDVLHRDLKPENVLLFTGDDGRIHVWLADLGLANASLALAKRKGRREGTPGYMAPEQFMGLPREYGPYTDIYALGVLIWELVTGDLPFEHHLTSANAQLPTLEPREGLLVPRDLALVLKNCLDPEPLSRYDLVADLRTELLALGPPDTARGGFDGPEERVGTVAKDAGTPGVKAKTTSQMLMSMNEAGPETSPGLDPYVPVWNRPIPSAVPAAAPPQVGFGTSARGSLQLFALRELPLVARDAYRQQIWDQAKSVAADAQCRVVLVVGSGGSGKSHLCESVVRSLHEGGWAEGVRFTHQNPRGAEDGYQGAARTLLRPWKESKASLVSRLRRRLARERGVLDAAVKEEASLLTRWCGVEDAESEEPVPQGLGLREVYRHLEARAWRGLSVLLVEDAHWALDEGDGLWLAESLLRGVAISGCLAIVTLRSEELARNAELAARVAAMVENGATRIDLAPLDFDGTRALLAESLSLEPALADQVAQRCEGNPLFARQLLLEWAARDWLVSTGGGFSVRDGVDTSKVLPTDAGDLLQARVEGLAEASGNHRRFRDTVHMSAMAGVDVPRDLVLLLAGDELEEFVLGCGLWIEREDRLRFGSNLLHQAVRGHAEERRDAQYLHRRLGRAWARVGELTGEDVDLAVGRHSMAGRDFELAITHLLTSCADSYRKRNTHELVEASGLAVEATYRAPGIADRAGWAALWRGRGFQMRGEVDHAAEHFRRAVEALKGRGDLGGMAQAQVGLAWALLQMGKLEQCDEAYGEALATARDANDMRTEVEVVQGRAWLEQQKRNFDGAEILFTRASNSWRKVGEERGIGEALRGQAFVSMRRGEFDEADEIYDEAIEAFQKGDDLLGTAWCLIGKGIVKRQRCRFDEAFEDFTSALSIAEELGATEIVMEARYRQAEVHRRRGEVEQAVRIYNDHARWAALHKKREAAIFAELGLAMVALARNDLDDLYERTNAVSRYLAGMPAHWLWATYRLVVAAMLAHRGDENQTYRWIWSASELGISDVVDEDIAYLLTDITAIAVRNDWRNVVRVAGKHAHTQLERLGDPAGAAFVKEQMDSVLLAR
ncbi:MAG: protein kinase [Alphaproteobacteria bacterium]|nr:protein kinase [Alphaproteobacteria bacterium]